MGTLEVINGKIHGFVGENIVYIGRLSAYGLYPLANPYRIGPDGDRAEVLAKYKQWLWVIIKEKRAAYWSLVSLAERVESGQNLRLACYCKPADCHGDVIIAAVNWLLKQPKSTW